MYTLVAKCHKVLPSRSRAAANDSFVYACEADCARGIAGRRQRRHQTERDAWIEAIIRRELLPPRHALVMVAGLAGLGGERLERRVISIGQLMANGIGPALELA